MTYDPHHTNVLPQVGQPFPITEELPAVGPPGRGQSGRWFLGLLGALLVAGIIAIAAILIIDDQRSNQVSTGDQDIQETPEPTAEPGDEPAPTAVPLEDADPGFWQVVGVADGLNVRSGPGTDNQIVGSLRLGDRHVFATGERATANGGEWTQIQFGQNDTIGWVSARFLQPDTAPDESAPTPTPAPSGQASIVCFLSEGTSTRVAEIVFTNRTELSGVVRTVSQQTSTDQTIVGTLSDGRAQVTLTNTESGDTGTQSWTFNPASVDLGNGRSLQVVDCDDVADQLP